MGKQKAGIPAGTHDGERTGTGRIRGRRVKRGENDRKDITVHCRIKSGETTLSFCATLLSRP